MNAYLLDTCVITEFVRPKPNPGVMRWVASIGSNAMFISSITIGELQKGVTKLGRTERAKRLQEWLDGDVRKWFAGRILSFDEKSASVWGKLTAQCERTGIPRPPLDSQIASIAIANEFVLVTRNVSDMDGMGVEVFNPWDEQ